MPFILPHDHAMMASSPIHGGGHGGGDGTPGPALQAFHHGLDKFINLFDRSVVHPNPMNQAGQFLARTTLNAHDDINYAIRLANDDPRLKKRASTEERYEKAQAIKNSLCGKIEEDKPVPMRIPRTATAAIVLVMEASARIEQGIEAAVMAPAAVTMIAIEEAEHAVTAVAQTARRASIAVGVAMDHFIHPAHHIASLEGRVEKVQPSQSGSALIHRSHEGFEI